MHHVNKKKKKMREKEDLLQEKYEISDGTKLATKMVRITDKFWYELWTRMSRPYLRHLPNSVSGTTESRRLRKADEKMVLHRF